MLWRVRSHGSLLISSMMSHSLATHHFLAPTVNKRGNRGRITLYIIIFSSVAIFVALLILGIIFLRLCNTNKSQPDRPDAKAMKHGDLFSIWNYDGKMAYEDIVEATEDFDIRYCIGTGGYGSVYKAQLPSGKVVALKKLQHFEGKVLAYDRRFRN